VEKRTAVTNWYPGFIKPVEQRTGWYERRLHGTVVLSHWNGRHWEAAPGVKSAHQDAPWRGLKREAK